MGLWKPVLGQLSFPQWHETGHAVTVLRKQNHVTSVTSAMLIEYLSYLPYRWAIVARTKFDHSCKQKYHNACSRRLALAAPAARLSLKTYKSLNRRRMKRTCSTVAPYTLKDERTDRQTICKVLKVSDRLEEVGLCLQVTSHDRSCLYTHRYIYIYTALPVNKGRVNVQYRKVRLNFESNNWLKFVGLNFYYFL